MPKRRKINIILDANWFISACISKKSRRLIYNSILKNPRLQVYYSVELLTEVEEVIARPKFARKIKPNQVIRFTALALAFMEEVAIRDFPALSRDSDDDYLLGLCEACQADFLITGDQDLLVLGTYQNSTILTMGQFLQLLPLIE